MNIGTITAEGTGLTNGHPPVIITGKIKAGTVCAMNGLLSFNETGEFEAFDLNGPNWYACVALEPITESTTAAKILLHGTFNSDMAVKADGTPPSAKEIAVAQSNGHIIFV